MPTSRRSHIRIAVFAILAVHLVLLFALLMAGCKKTSEQAKNDVPADTGAPVPPPFDPNVPPAGSNPPGVSVTGTTPIVTTSSPVVTPSRPREWTPRRHLHLPRSQKGPNTPL